MKKILALVLVLGLAAMANATYTGPGNDYSIVGNMYLTIDGQPAPDEITLDRSQWIEIDIDVAGPVPPAIGPDSGLLRGFDVTLEMSNAQAAMDYTNLTFLPEGHMNLFMGSMLVEIPWAGTPKQVVDMPGYEPTPQRTLLTGYAGDYPTIGNYTLVNGIMLHCEDTTDVVLTLYAGYPDGSGAVLWGDGSPGVPDQGSSEAGTILDQITIIQIPEPITMTLLGLGGLALIRRRR